MGDTSFDRRSQPGGAGAGPGAGGDPETAAGAQAHDPRVRLPRRALLRRFLLAGGTVGCAVLAGCGSLGSTGPAPQGQAEPTEVGPDTSATSVAAPATPAAPEASPE